LTPAGTPTGAKRTESFAYDALGNRVRLNYLAGRGWMDFLRRDNGLNQYSSWTPSVIYYDDNYPGWGPGGNGVMMAEGWFTASYNALNQPVVIWSPATPNFMWFGYDPLGRCVKRWVNGSGAATTNPATYLYYEGWNLIQEGTGAAAADRIYLPGNRVDGIVCHYNYAAAQWRYHHYDARGHCILLTGPTGNLIEQYEYDAFGNPYFYDATGGTVSSAALGNRFLFTGREWLSELKLYDYRNRLYQPELGRFLQPDPKQFQAGDYNLYRYCHNDPVNRTDPFGLQDEKVVREFTKNVPVLGSNIPLHIRYTESGNWNDTRIANHYDSNLKNRTGLGGTTKGVGSFTQSGHDIHIDLNVNWLVDSQYANTDAVARELQHVRDYRAFSNAFANSLGPNQPLPSLAGFPSRVVAFQGAQQAKYDPHLKIDMPHNLEYYPPRPFMLPTFENTANEIGH
jgi:RHS repeat-associated protein